MIPIVTYLTLSGFVSYTYNSMACSTGISDMGVNSSRFSEITRGVWLTHESQKRAEKRITTVKHTSQKKITKSNYSNSFHKLDPGS